MYKLRYQAADKDVMITISLEERKFVIYTAGKPLCKFDICDVWDMTKDALVNIKLDKTLDSPGLDRRQKEAAAANLYTLKKVLHG